MAIQSKWLQGQKDPEAFEVYVRNSIPILDQLTKIIKQEIESLEMPVDIENSAWPLKVAERQGTLKAFRAILKYTEIK
jgi:hypothetical protein